MRSRKMPALLTRMSTLPKASSAALTILSALPGSLIDSVEAIAWPPAFLISSTTSCAGPASVPAPSRLAPISQTTTLAPSCAIRSAMPRPMPRAAPVTMATFPATMFAIGLCSPDFLCDLADHLELGPLLVLGEDIAFLGRGEAALRRQAKLLEIGEFGGFLDAALDGVFGFQRPSLGRHQAQHHAAAFLQTPQRLKTAGAVGVVFHEIAVHLDLVEQHFLLGLVAAGAHVGRFVVAAAQMHCHRHVRRNVGHRDVDELAVERAERVRIVAAILHLLAIFRIAQHGDEDFVELQVAAAGVGEGAHGFFVGLAEIGEHRVEPGIDRLVDRRADRAAVQRRRRRDRYLRGTPGVRLDELEMLDHRMAGEADFAGDLGAFVARPRAGKRDAGLHDGLLDAVEAPEEIEMPPRAAEFAVGDRLQAGRFLLPDGVLDLAVLHCFQLVRRDLALGAALARRFQRRGPQQAADVIGAERRLGSLHDVTLLLSPTLRRRSRRSSAAWPIPLPRQARCLPRWKRSRIAATGRAARYRRISPPARCGA